MYGIGHYQATPFPGAKGRTGNGVVWESGWNQIIPVTPQEGIYTAAAHDAEQLASGSLAERSQSIIIVILYLYLLYVNC